MRALGLTARFLCRIVSGGVSFRDLFRFGTWRQCCYFGAKEIDTQRTGISNSTATVLFLLMASDHAVEVRSTGRSGSRSAVSIRDTDLTHPTT